MKDRESNFELLRLVAMYFILLYHMLGFFIVRVDDAPLYKALWLPLHVAVACFVLISGYFHIKPSFKGTVKLLAPLIVFYLPLTIFELIYYGGGYSGLLFFSQSPYWFIRVYFYLFMISPALNMFIANKKRMIYLLLVLGFISLYMGTMQDTALQDGKNLVLFMFLYTLGDCIRTYWSKLDKFKTIYLVGGYVFLNIGLVVVYCLTFDKALGRLLWEMSFPYCSPILILNAVMLFLLFGRLSFKSRAVNKLASSVFAVYIIHHQHFVLYSVLGPVVLKVHEFMQQPLYVIPALCVVVLIIMFVCIGVDKLFSPLWRLLHQLADKIDKKYEDLLLTVNGRE